MNDRISAKDALDHPFFKQKLAKQEENLNQKENNQATKNLECEEDLSYLNDHESNENSKKVLSNLPDITNVVFQPNILKRKRSLANKQINLNQ
jgi:hypothetical protein